MKKSNKLIIISSILIILIIVSYFGYQMYIKNLIEKNLYDYFKNNNSHISSYDFKIENLKIVCKGNKAYIVDFAISFNDIPNELQDLGALVYQKDKKWNVKSILNKDTINEIDSYDLKCYKKE